MTKKEAIEWLTDIKCVTDNWAQEVALDMAIEALQWQDRILTQIEEIMLKEHGERSEE